MSTTQSHIGSRRYLRLGDTDDGACVSTHELGDLGTCSPETFGALRSLLRPYLYSNLYLDSMPLEYQARVFLERHSPCSGIAEPSLHVVLVTGYGQKGHRTRQFEGGH